MAKNSGYILIVTLMMITGAIAIGTYIFVRGSTYLPFIQVMIAREKAHTLAQGALAISESQLTLFEFKQEGEENKKPTQDDVARVFWERITPTINRWQTYQLKKAIDGIDAEIKVCMIAEDGKININKIYDFKKKEFVGKGQVNGDWHVLMEFICKRIQEILGGKDIFKSLEQFLSKRGRPLDDVTELLTIKEFAIFKQKIFYEPATGTSGTIYLTDIFTVQSIHAKLQPWLLSDSLLRILQFKSAQPGDTEGRTNIIKKLSKEFKKSVQWKQSWDTLLKPLYEKELQSLPKGLDSVLDTSFDPTTFAVLVHGTVGSVTQRLLAIMERYKRARNGENEYDVSIKKLYWL